MIKTICPYCGGRCETTGGPDGNPFNKNSKEKTVCTACGRTVSESDPLKIPEEDLKELLTDIDIIDIDMTDDDINDTDTADADMSISDIVDPPEAE